MSTLLVSAAYAAELTQDFKGIFRKVPEGITLGEPVILVNPDTGLPWEVYDGSMTLDDASYLGWALVNPAQVENALSAGDSADFIRAEVREMAHLGGVVMPYQLDLGNSLNPYQSVLEAQGVLPSRVRMGGGVPAGWYEPLPEL